MDLLKKFFPFSFKSKPRVVNLVLTVVIYALVGIIAGTVFGAVGGLIPQISAIFALIGSLFDLYITAGIVLVFLHYFKVIKTDDPQNKDE